MERGCEAIAVLLGIVAAGAAYAPLDPASPVERNARILDDLGCRVVVADAAGRDSVPCGPAVRVVDGPRAASHTEAHLPAGPGGEHLAYVMYTSGSTGMPKGVMVPHRAVLRLALGEGLERCNDGDRVLQAGPLAFDASTFEIWGPLLNGGEVCIADRDALLDPRQFADTLERYAITRLFVTTALFNRQIDALPSSFRGTRVVLVGGEALSTPHMRRAVAACPATVFANGYGPTENTTFTTTHEIRAADLEAASIPIGRPLAHTTVCILDAQGQPAAPGVWGEICTGGDGLALGYRNQPQLTAERFVPDPQRPGALLYRTGDLGRWRDDGAVEFGGRLDGQIKLRGFRIELDEIAQALASHPAIGQAAALFLPDAGEIVGCVLPHASPPQEDDLRRWIARALPAYMVPSRLVEVDDMPLNANGKIDRARLHAGLDAARPLPRSSRRAEPPRSDAEVLVAAAFAEIFGRPVDDRRANFLELGGHSLLAIRLVNLIAGRTGTRIAMSAFFEHPTVEGIAALVEPGAQAGGRITPAPQAEAYPASHAQRRLYLLHAMDRGSGAYNMSFVWRLGAGFEPEALRAALAGLVRRHETLRTGFAETDGEIVQRVCEIESVPFAVDDLRGRPDAQAQALRLARRELGAPFDLAQPPLARARVLRLGNDDDIVLLVLHHIAADGWSTRILLRELGALYAAARDGRTVQLPPLPVAYRDFAVWQHRQDWTAAAAYWRERLAGAPDRIALPTDRPAAQVQTYRGATARRELPPDIASGLHALAARTGATAAAVGLALFAALLYRLTRQADMVIGMGVTGRDHAELEGLIGFFVNVLPIRLQLDEEIELDALIGQAHRAMLGALDRRDYPFDMLVRDVAPRRQSNRQPLINVVFEYQRFADLDAGLAAGAPEGLPATAVVDDAIGRELGTLVDSATAKHDLIVFFQEEGDRARLLMEYDIDILDRATAERWMDYLADFAAMAARAAEGATQ
jgi:amino acid adenylation domain-containing protein